MINKDERRERTYASRWGWRRPWAGSAGHWLACRCSFLNPLGWDWRWAEFHLPWSWLVTSGTLFNKKNLKKRHIRHEVGQFLKPAWHRSGSLSAVFNVASLPPHTLFTTHGFSFRLAYFDNRLVQHGAKKRILYKRTRNYRFSET